MIVRLLQQAILILALSACGRASIADYDDCILSHANGATNPSSLQAIKTSCKQKFPKEFDFAEIAKTAGAPPWSTIATSPKYQALEKERRESVRISYVTDVIEPRVHPDFKDEAFAQFAKLANSVEPPANSSDRISPKVVETPNANSDTKKARLPEPLPATGFEIVRSTDKRLGPLTIVTKSDEQHFFVKLVDSVTNQPAIGIFLRAGETVQTKVPIGKFRLKYASGRDWYGENLLFGEQTGYFVADKEFEFRLENGKVSGYSIELFLQPNGNLPTTRLDPTQW